MNYISEKIRIANALDREEKYIELTQERVLMVSSMKIIPASEFDTLFNTYLGALAYHLERRTNDSGKQGG